MMASTDERTVRMISPRPAPLTNELKLTVKLLWKTKLESETPKTAPKFLHRPIVVVTTACCAWLETARALIIVLGKTNPCPSGTPEIRRRLTISEVFFVIEQVAIDPSR